MIDRLLTWRTRPHDGPTTIIKRDLLQREEEGRTLARFTFGPD
jgi:hypothetical protein